MKIRIEETIYEGTGAEILDQLRLASFDPLEFPDAESYLWQLQNNFIRMTDQGTGALLVLVALILVNFAQDGRPQVR